MEISELSPWIAAGKDSLVGLSAVSAAIFAYLGLSAWKKELKGKAEYQLAKDVLKSVYKVREAFKHVRNPAIYQYEYPEDMTDYHGHLKREYKHEGTVYVYENRWKVMAEAFSELEEHHLNAQVEWGAEFQDTIVKLRSCRVELQITIQQLLERKKDAELDRMTTREQRAAERSVLYYGGEDSEYDKFTPEINQAIDKFEKWLRPHINKRG
ncbi:MAG: hypothetical protein R3331_00030 [Sulfurospirillaceae bacterium]|nr:hypothetical protein [Sulfurospirillaceae bacterium]